MTPYYADAWLSVYQGDSDRSVIQRFRREVEPLTLIKDGWIHEATRRTTTTPLGLGGAAL
jgi:hypothetical protein